MAQHDSTGVQVLIQQTCTTSSPTVVPSSACLCSSYQYWVAALVSCPHNKALGHHTGHHWSLGTCTRRCSALLTHGLQLPPRSHAGARQHKASLKDWAPASSGPTSCHTSSTHRAAYHFETHKPC
jgi:hypothetical protein